MKDNLTQLYPNEKVGARVGNYAFAHSTSLPKHMLEHHAWASDNHEHPNMMISPLQAQFHVWMAKAVAAKRGELPTCSSIECPDTIDNSGNADGSQCWKLAVL
jgi:hypothetical protein